MHVCTKKKHEHSLFRASLRSVPALSLFLLLTLSALLNICLPLKLAGVMGLPLLSIAALQPQPTRGGLQKGYVKNKISLRGKDCLREPPKLILKLQLTLPCSFYQLFHDFFNKYHPAVKEILHCLFTPCMSYQILYIGLKCSH